MTCQSCLADPLALFRAPVAVPAPSQTQWAYLRYRRLKAETDRTSLLGYLDILGRCWDRLGFVYPVACCSLQLAIAQRSADKLRHMPGLPGRVPMGKKFAAFCGLAASGCCFGRDDQACAVRGISCKWIQTANRTQVLPLHQRLGRHETQ